MAKSLDEYLTYTGLETMPRAVDRPATIPFLPPSGLLLADRPIPGVTNYLDYSVDPIAPQPMFARPEDYGHSSILTSVSTGTIQTNQVDSVSVPFSGELKQKILAASFGTEAPAAQTSESSLKTPLLIAAGILAAVYFWKKS